MIDIKNKADCCGCSACEQICPQKCILMTEDIEGFKYPIVNNQECIKCGMCIKICPILKQKQEKKLFFQNKELECYSAINRDDKKRLQSSSGGIFSLIAERIIADDGVVFGAAMSKDCRSVHHVFVNSVDEMIEIIGSKYVQSDIGDSFIKAKHELEKGRKVLFSGTPCHIAALKTFLRRDYENLFTIDFICHGVPSPKVWRKYINYREKKDNGIANKVYFRRKVDGWKNFSINIVYEGGKEYVMKKDKDLYMQAFSRDVCLRQSCYQCVFKGTNHASDLTIADFWGVQNISRHMDDDKGTSLIIINSHRGKEIFNAMSSSLVSNKEKFDLAIKYNPAYLYSSKPNRKRKQFFRYLDRMSFDKLIKKEAPRRMTYKERIVFITNKIGITQMLLRIYRKLKTSK